MGSRQARLLEANYRAVRYDIYKFCKALNFTPTWQQRQLLDLVQAPESRKKIAVKSGKGPGKTTISGVAALWWLLRSEGCKVILTAPTMRQCKDIWMAELRRTLKNAEPWLQYLIKTTALKAYIRGNPDWSIQVCTATNDEALQGWHEKTLKVIVEEASGVDRGLIQTLRDTLSNPNSAMLMIGNPNTRDCAFFDCFNTERSKWQTLTFNAEETPESEFFDPRRNKELEEEFGRDSDIYRIAVLGEFPHADPNCVISSEDLEKCSDKKNMLAMVKASKVKQFGLDFARFGGDELTLYRRSGEAIVQWTRMVRCDPSLLVNQAFLWQDQAGWKDQDCWYIPDAGGMGQGIMHKFYDAGKNVLEFHNGSSAIQSARYGNKVTEAWFDFARKVRAGKAYIPQDNFLIQQLCGRQYFINKKGLIVLEPKEDYVKRGHDSPDRADGCVMAFYDHAVAASGLVSGGYGSGRKLGVEHR